MLSPLAVLARNFFSLSFVQLANNLLPLITIPYVVRVVGAEKYGAVIFASAFVAYFTYFINYSFDLTATREIAKNGEDRHIRSTVFSQVLYAKMLLFLLAAAVFVLLINLVPQLATEKTLFIYSFIYCFSLVITPNWLFQGLQQLHVIAICNLVAKILFTAAIFLVIKESKDYIFHPLIYSVSAILLGIGMFIWSYIKFKIKLKPFECRNTLKLLWQENPIFLSFIVINLYTMANLIILGLVQDNHDVAMYSAGWKLITVSQTLIILPLSLTLFPFLGEKFGEGRTIGIEKINQIAPFLMLAVFIVGIFLWIAAPMVIHLFYGQEFTESILVLRILCMVPLIGLLANLFGIQAMVNLKMDKPLLKITLLALCFGLILSFFLAKNYSYSGAAWAWLTTETLSVLLMWNYLNLKNIRIMKWRYFSMGHFQTVSKPLFASIKERVNKNN